jgi:6-phosphogluconate dehydrogenase
MNAQEIAILGLGTMGRNLALNFRDKGIRVHGFDPGPETRAAFAAAAAGTLHTSLAELLRAMASPRVICLLVPAGDAVTQLMDELLPLLATGDILIDAGNSHFRDTEARQAKAARMGIDFIGMGVSGGEAGARHGPAIMIGGTTNAAQRVAARFTPVAAPAAGGGRCLTVAGPGGAGHFVKMMHNGIEYADMQCIAEVVYLLRRLGGMPPADIAVTFRSWQTGELASYLTEITATVLDAVDPTDGAPLLDRITDVAGQKGTGLWSVTAALELGVPVPAIAEAVFARQLSARRAERTAQRLAALPATPVLPRDELLAAAHATLVAAKLSAFAQGFAVIAAASKAYGWSIDLAALAQGWTNGCIIRARLLDDIIATYRRTPDLDNLLCDAAYAQTIDRHTPGWRTLLGHAVAHALPTPVLGASLAWRDAFAAGRLWTDLIQGQRDCFGAHGFERVDQAGTHHHRWPAP